MIGELRLATTTICLYLLVVLLASVSRAGHYGPMPKHWHPPGWWEKQAACIRAHEGAWTSNTGNGYYGAYQFLLSTWRAVGGVGYPHQATPQEQSYRAWLNWRANGRRWAGQWGTAGMCGLR